MSGVHIGWHELGLPRAEQAAGAAVELHGFPAPLTAGSTARRFLLTAEPGCCLGCAPRDSLAAVSVFAAQPVPMQAGALRLSGTWRVAAATEGPRYELHEASTCEPPGWRGISRRGVLAAGPMICLGVAAGQRAARAENPAGPTVDIHSHSGGIASPPRIRNGTGFSMVADPMRRGGMAAICLAVVSDGPTHHVAADGRIHPFRDPEPGELYEYGTLAFRRVTELARAEGLSLIDTAAALRAAQAGRPSYIMSAEGADFLEGQVDRVDEALARWRLRHLQLVHYRVNELGDIQTETPVHGGLTEIGAAVIRRCNALGLVVDVAHATLDLVKRAAAVTTKPLVLSHTSLHRDPSRFSRLITPDHARIVAGTGGVIGVWPPASIMHDMPGLAAGIARMVDAVGIDHVGLGSDMRGLVGHSVLPDYHLLPELADALAGAGFHTDEVAKLLGGNYVRVFAECVG